MADGYALYGASAADFVGSGVVGGPLLIAQATLEVWDAVENGTQVTDLLDTTDTPTTTVATDSFGNFRFQAPDTLGTLWVAVVGAGGQRYAVIPSDLADRVNVQASAAAVSASAAQTSATAAALAADRAEEAEQRIIDMGVEPGTGGSGKAGIFVVNYDEIAGAWEHLTLESALASGMLETDRAWFLGAPVEVSPPAWIRDRDLIGFAGSAP